MTQTTISGVEVKGARFFAPDSSYVLAFADSVSRSRPDVIIAMSRKAPRLLEVLTFWEIDYGIAPVLTERAVLFTDKEYFCDKRVLIVDDIIIVGTNMRKTLREDLKDKLSLSKEIAVCTLAIDSEWFQEKLFSGVPMTYSLAVQGADSFVFCQEVVRSFRYLSKPYDLDHCIMYLDHDGAVYCLGTESPDEAFDLTTLFQRTINRQQRTFIPCWEYATDFVQRVVHPELRPIISVWKVRSYENLSVGWTTLVPMLTVSIEAAGLLSPSGPFGRTFEAYNDPFAFVREMPDVTEHQRAQAAYHLFWYCLSYLWGLFFVIRNGIQDKLWDPKQFLAKQDLVYLFGYEFSTRILSGFCATYDETLSSLRTLAPTDGGRSPMSGECAASGHASGADIAAAPGVNGILCWCEEAKRYAKTQRASVAHGPTIASLAVPFESLFYNVEMAVRRSVSQSLSQCPPDEYKINEALADVKYIDRLRCGLTWEQIIRMLGREHLFDPDAPGSALKLSLAMDLLVDLGVVVPIPYLNESTDRWERRYRAGETATSICGIRTLIRRVLRAVQQKSDETGRKLAIAREKVLAMLWYKIIQGGYNDTILAPQDESDTMYVDVSYCVHGAVFSRFVGERKDILTEWFGASGAKGRDIFDGATGYTFPVTPEIETDFDAWTNVLLHIEASVGADEEDVHLEDGRKLYKRNIESRYLVGLSTLYDYEPYLDTIREELTIFFWNFEKTTVTACNELIAFAQESKQGTFDTFSKSLIAQRDQLRKCLKHLHDKVVAINQITMKQTLFESMPEIAETIDAHFRSLPSLHTMRLQYHLSSDGYSIARRIQSIIQRRVPRNIDAIQMCEKQIVRLASACVSLMDILYCARDALCSFMTRTRTGRIYKQSQGSLERLGRHLQEELCPEAMKKCNDLSRSFAGHKCVFVPAEGSSLPDILESCLVAAKVGLQDAKLIYDEFFDTLPWQELRERMFPIEKTEQYFWVGFDVRGSEDSAADQEATDHLVRDLNRRRLKGDAIQKKIAREDVVPVGKPNEGGNVLCRFEVDVATTILLLYETASMNSKALRIGIMSTWDTKKPIKRRRAHKYDNVFKLIIDRDEDEDVGRNYATMARFLGALKDKESESEIDRTAFTVVLSEYVLGQLRRLGFPDSIGLDKVSVTVSRREGETYSGWVIQSVEWPTFVDFLRHLRDA